jgi:phospholipid transport system substrate-binding protein
MMILRTITALILKKKSSVGIMSLFRASTAKRMIRRHRVAAVGLLFLFCILLPAPSRAGGPTEQVRATVDKVLTIVRNPNLKPEDQKEDLQARLAEVISSRFDFAEMAKRSLGPHWARRSSEEQGEFVKVFAGLLGKTYAERIEFFTSQKILYTREIDNQDYAEVDTKIVSDKREEMSINYKLYSVNKEWKVYDVVIEDISLVNNYRSQFDRVIARSSFEELVRMMRERQS